MLQRVDEVKASLTQCESEFLVIFSAGRHGFGASTRLCTYDLPRLCTCDSPRLCTYDFLVDAIRMPASCAMGHSNVLVLDMHVLFGTKMFALLLGSMVFCIVNAKHVELLRQDGFDLRVEKSCLSSLTGILLCCMCNLSCEFFTEILSKAFEPGC